MVYDVPTARSQVLSAVDAAGTLQQPSSVNGTPPPLPTFADGTIVYKQVKESDIGRDLNEDGDMNDVVTLVDGDSDGDGVFDSGDVCTETSNPNQLDTDGDLLPDACDPNPYCGNVAPMAPPAPPADAEACQKSVAKAALKPSRRRRRRRAAASTRWRRARSSASRRRSVAAAS